MDAHAEGAARLESGLIGFYVSRGHSHEEAKEMVKAHLAGQVVVANDPPESPSPPATAIPVPAEGETVSDGVHSTAILLGQEPILAEDHAVPEAGSTAPAHDG